MNTSVLNQLVQSQAGDFTANRIKAGQDDGFRRVIYNDFNTGSRFQSTDITSFATDDTTFDLIRFDMEDGD